jgi:hypothetical protein
MGPELFAILSLTVLGLPITIALDRSTRGALLLGLSFLFGSGALFLVMLAMSVARLPWSLPAVVIGLLLVWLPAAFVARRGIMRPDVNSSQPPLDRARQRSRSIAWIADAATCVMVAGHFCYATLAPLWEWDFWAIWGLKARVFFEARTIDWQFLERGANRFAHPDYPLLLPMNFDFVALLRGSWSDRWLGLLFVAFGAACLLVLRDLLAREMSPALAALATFAASSAALTRFVGLAEGPLIAFGAAAILLIRRGLQKSDRGALRQGAVLLGFAASCKNEGLALTVCVIAAALVVAPRAWRRVVALWPAIAVALPWLILRALHVLPTDLVEGSVASRLSAHLRISAEIMSLLARALIYKWFWLAIAISLLIVPYRMLVRERFVLIALLAQIGCYLCSYLVTPNDVVWHIETSWSRLTLQITIPFLAIVTLMLAPLIESLLAGETAAKPFSESPSREL